MPSCNFLNSFFSNSFCYGIEISKEGFGDVGDDKDIDDGVADDDELNVSREPVRPLEKERLLLTLQADPLC